MRLNKTGLIGLLITFVWMACNTTNMARLWVKCAAQTFFLGIPMLSELEKVSCSLQKPNAQTDWKDIALCALDHVWVF